MLKKSGLQFGAKFLKQIKGKEIKRSWTGAEDCNIRFCVIFDRKNGRKTGH